MKRSALLVIVTFIAVHSAACTRIANRVMGLDALENRIELEPDVMVPMSDGVRLATDIYKPVGLERGPVVLIRTPYNKSAKEFTAYAYKIISRHGYFVAVQDCRGRFASEGEFYPFINESRDGKDTVAWLVKQPWCDGHVGTWGASYFGYTQWALADGNRDLDAMVSYLTTAGIEKILYQGGALNYQNILFWSSTNSEQEAMEIPKQDMKEAVWNLPLSTSDDKAAGFTVPMFDDVVNFDVLEYREAMAYDQKFDEVSAPSYNVAGWYDLFQKFQIEDFMAIRREAEEPARSMSRMVVGPWGHGFFSRPAVRFDDGSIARLPQFERMMDFLDQMLKGEDRGVEDWPPWRIYVMGAEEWRDFETWPPENMRPVPCYFHSGGEANSAGGGGTLSFRTPGQEPADGFAYDPRDPVPTAGGPLLVEGLGPVKQKEVEAREDVLVYTSDALESPLTLMGPVKVVLYASSDAPDTDFTAKLCDVYPNGKSVNITDGIVRARFRKGDVASPEPITPGETYEYEIDLWYTAYLFKPGHRVRVQVSSSNFPRFDRNLNTGKDMATGTEMRVARQKVFHDSKRPSHILLPVVE